VMPHRSAFGSDNELGVAPVSSGRRAESPDRLVEPMHRYL
jgi:hypothetical protein